MSGFQQMNKNTNNRKIVVLNFVNLRDGMTEKFLEKNKAQEKLDQF